MLKSTRTKNKGGKGKRDDARNYALVVLREGDPDFFTFEVLGRIFGLNKKTVHEIYKRDRERYIGE